MCDAHNIQLQGRLSIRLRGNTSKRELLSETEGWLEGGGAALRTDMLSVRML